MEVTLGLSRFATELRDAVELTRIPRDVASEQDLERRVLLPIASDLAARHHDVLVYSHRFGEERTCSPTCVHELPAASGRAFGCPKCWSMSKTWATTGAFGTRHTFDLVAKDRSKTLAVELKLSGVRHGRMPNGDLQRFLGQCALAAAKHSIVIGLFAYRGSLNEQSHADSRAVSRWFTARNVTLVFRPVARAAHSV